MVSEMEVVFDFDNMKGVDRNFLEVSITTDIVDNQHKHFLPIVFSKSKSSNVGAGLSSSFSPRGLSFFIDDP